MRFAISIPQQVADGTFDPAAMRGYLTRAEELGAGMILLNPLSDEAEQMERLAAQVMPRLSGPA